MIKASWLLVIGIAFIAAIRHEGGKGETFFFIADSIKTEIHLTYDTAGILEGYRAVVNTPVCEDERCYAVELEFYWDLIGNYAGYDTIVGMALTKLDHIPFTTEDYQKLNAILSNSNSSLGLYDREELVQSSRSSDLDGITGATRSEIKNSVIDGAVYSCYTLWHIAHGQAVDSIRQATSRSFSKKLVQKLVRRQDQEINYYLIQYFTDEDFVEYLREVFDCLKVGEGYFVKKAVEQMPVAALVAPISQAYFTENFGQLDYFAQLALLKKLQDCQLEQDFKSALRKSMSDRNSYRDELIRTILAD